MINSTLDLQRQRLRARFSDRELVDYGYLPSRVAHRNSTSVTDQSTSDVAADPNSSSAAAAQTNSPVAAQARWKTFQTNRSSETTSAWLISPVFDLLFVCGIAPWILGFICYIIVGPQFAKTASPMQIALTVSFIVAAFVIGEAHQFTSIIRYYTTGKELKLGFYARLPFWWAYTLIAVALIESFQPTSIGAFILNNSFMFMGLVFPVVLMHHICVQALGVGLRYCHESGYSLSQSERRSINWISRFLLVTGASYMAGPFIVPAFPREVSMWCIFIAAFAFIGFSAHVLSRGLKTGEWPPTSVAYLAINTVLYILLPFFYPELRYVWVFIPIFFHATQHWAIAWATKRKETSTSQQTDRIRMDTLKDLAGWMIPIEIITMVVLFFPLLVFNSDGTTHSITLTLLPSMLVFYLHYVADRVVWRSPKRAAESVNNFETRQKEEK